MIKTLLFDNNGVVTFSDDEYTVPAIAEFLGMDKEVLRPVFHSLAVQFDRGEVSVVQFYQSIADYFGIVPDMAPLLKVVDGSYSLRPGMKDLLAQLGKKYEIAMLTNFGDTFDWFNQNIWRLDEVFDDDKIFVSAKVGMIKPNADFFYYALDSLGKRAGEVVFVDDRESNITAARALGMKTILFVSPEQFQKELAVILGGEND